MNTDSARAPSFAKIFTTSLLVFGNVLGVGVLALPITSGLGGFVPALLGIVGIWCVMLIAAWIIAARIDPKKKNFDLPSFYHQELGTAGKWIAIICNLIILYGVLVAYLSGISSMLTDLFSSLEGHTTLITFIYFCITTALIIFGLKALKSGMVFLIAAIWICFFLMVITGFSHFELSRLSFTDWKYIPIVLPIAVSAFHFHNIIPTVSKSLDHDQKATRKAIFLGVFMGLIINLIWVVIVLGTLPENGAGAQSIVYANWHGLTANVPMSQILNNDVFLYSGLLFGVLAVTSSFMTNGAGLFGFIQDLTTTYLKTENKLLVGALAFLPP
nr:aromatic amino acid transport family protein [Dongshaea marina]